MKEKNVGAISSFTSRKNYFLFFFLFHLVISHLRLVIACIYLLGSGGSFSRELFFLLLFLCPASGRINHIYIYSINS